MQIGANNMVNFSCKYTQMPLLIKQNGLLPVFHKAKKGAVCK